MFGLPGLDMLRRRCSAPRLCETCRVQGTEGVGRLDAGVLRSSGGGDTAEAEIRAVSQIQGEVYRGAGIKYVRVARWRV